MISSNLLMDLALDPQWVREMGQAHMDLLITCLQHCLALGAKPDGIFLVDDFGCTRGLLFSPDMWRDIFKPLYVQLAEFLHAEGISLWLHSCGDVRALIPELIAVVCIHTLDDLRNCTHATCSAINCISASTFWSAQPPTICLASLLFRLLTRGEWTAGPVLGRTPSSISWGICRRWHVTEKAFAFKKFCFRHEYCFG